MDDCEEIEASIMDHHGAEIPLERFESIVKQFMRSGSFYINIELLNRPNSSSAQVCTLLIIVLCIFNGYFWTLNEFYRSYEIFCKVEKIVNRFSPNTKH